ncbi:MAG: helix-hairpin-helix domain-containing protein [Chloroflexota bacterium]
MKSGWQITIGIIGGLLGAGILLLINSNPRGEAIHLLPPPSPPPITVHISGAVVNPGVYTFTEDTRVQFAIDAAGGTLPNASSGQVNLAALLKDGEKINIPFLPPPGSANSATNSGFPININTATLTELQLLPGIGPSKAQLIISYRGKNGAFSTIEQIQNVSGFGPASFESLMDLITVSP